MKLTSFLSALLGGPDQHYGITYRKIVVPPALRRIKIVLDTSSTKRQAGSDLTDDSLTAATLSSTGLSNGNVCSCCYSTMY